MKKIFILLSAIFLFSTAVLSAQEEIHFEDSVFATKKEFTLNPFIEFFVSPWYSASFNEGISYAQITRIELMENRSNFVRETFLAGAFVNMKTEDLGGFDFVIQLGAYYPFRNAFNGMQQFPKQTLLYAVDSYGGTLFNIDLFQYLLFDVSVGMHFMYQLTDEYHMLYLGLGTLNTIEFPLTKNWSIVNNYFFSYDNANLGSNKNIQKFKAAYQYHIDLGVRFSKKHPNTYYYIDTDAIKEKKQQRKLEK